jgi:hypothetical protein
MDFHTPRQSVKVNDMAVIIESEDEPWRVGHFVKVVARAPLGSFDFADENYTIDEPNCWCIVYTDGSGDVWAGRCLQPIRGILSASTAKEPDRMQNAA